jgi:hypothetical protein
LREWRRKVLALRWAVFPPIMTMLLFISRLLCPQRGEGGSPLVYRRVQLASGSLLDRSVDE